MTHLYFFFWGEGGGELHFYMIWLFLIKKTFFFLTGTNNEASEAFIPITKFTENKDMLLLMHQPKIIGQ